MSDIKAPPRPLNAFFAFRTLSHYAMQTTPTKTRNRDLPEKQINAPEFLASHPVVARRIKACFKKTESQFKLKKKGERQGKLSQACGAAWKEFCKGTDDKTYQVFDKLVKDAVAEHKRRWPDYQYCPGARKGAMKAKRVRMRRATALTAEPSTSAFSSTSSNVFSPAPASLLTPLDEIEGCSFPEHEEPYVEEDTHSPQMGTGMDCIIAAPFDGPFVAQQHHYAAPTELNQYAELERYALPAAPQPTPATPYIDILAPWSPEAQVSVWGALGQPGKPLDDPFTFPPLKETVREDAVEWTYGTGWF